MFIHGLGGGPDDGGSKRYWGNFPRLVEQDVELAERYDVLFFSYASAKIVGYPSTPVPESAAELARKIRTDWSGYDAFDIIAHSQGGLVIRRYIADQVIARLPSRIGRIILYDTPNTGAALASIVSVPGIGLAASKEVKDLAQGSQMLKQLLRDEAAHDAHLTVPTLFVVAGVHNVVNETAAWGIGHPGAGYVVLNGRTHGTIIDPKDANDPVFTEARRYLLDPNVGIADDPKAVWQQPELSSKQFTDLSDADRTTGRFVYWNRAVPFIGRDLEMGRIETFLYDSSRRFMWMLLTGVGGMGKSRVALETVLRQRLVHWRAGFLAATSDEAYWRRWQPTRPTLLVIDYAARELGKVETILRGLAQREMSAPLRRPVRVLLIERDQADPRLKEMLARLGRDMPDSARANDLPLAPMDVSPIIRHVLGPEGDVATALQALAAVDPDHRRPLFAYLIADAMVNGRDVRQWDRDALMRDILDRERTRHWQPAAEDLGLAGREDWEAVERAITLATVVGGLRITNFPAAAALADYLLPAWRPGAHSSLLSLMTGRPIRDHVPPLEPDIIGEFFVLRQLGVLSKQRLVTGATVAEALVDRAWETNVHTPALFFDRVRADFPEDAAYRSLLLTPPRSEIVCGCGETATDSWAALAGNLTIAWSERVDALDDAIQLHEALKALALGTLRKQLASTAFSLLNGFIKAKDWSRATSMYDELKELTSGSDATAEIREYQAKAVTNLCVHLGVDPAWRPIILSAYTDVKMMASGPYATSALREQQAKAGRNFCSQAATDEEWRSQATMMYKDVRGLAQGTYATVALRDLQGVTGFNIVTSLSTNELWWPQADLIYEELKELASDATATEVLRVEQTKAGRNLIRSLGRSEAWRPRATSIYEELRELASGSQATPSLREHQAWAGYSLLQNLGEVEAWRPHAVSVYDELKALASNTLTTSPSLLEVQATAGSDLCADLSEVEAWRQRAVSIYEDLKDLASRHPETSVLREQQARAGFNLIRGLGTDETWRALALSTYEDLKALPLIPPLIREWQARAAGALMWRFCQDAALDERLEQAYRAYIDLRGHRDVLRADLYLELINIATVVLRERLATHDPRSEEIEANLVSDSAVIKVPL